MVREMKQSYNQRVLEIYTLGLETRNATFETVVPHWNEWDLKHLKHSRFVYENNDMILGWIALSPVSDRKVYEGIAEVSIYVDINFVCQGIGSALMERAIISSESNGIWTLFSSVFPENKATLRLHEKFGFRIIGTREKIARLNGIWRDTVLLERRSKLVI
jgi:L-amino acid N-acyltransferase YncA